MRYLHALIWLAVPLTTAHAQPSAALTDEDFYAAIDVGYQKLQGLWVCESEERNGAPPWDLFDQGIYIERTSVVAVTKEGEFSNKSRWAEFRITPVQGVMTFDVFGGGPNEVAAGILKFE